MVQETISGFKTKGSWDDVVKHGEQISQILRKEGVEGKEFDEWEEWRPRSTEDIGHEIQDKTAEQVSVDPEESSGIKKTGKQVFQTIEETVYKNIMVKTNPCYFDNELISANIEKKTSVIGGSDKFSLEVKVYDSHLKDEIRKKLN